MKILFVSPKGPLYRHRGGIFRKSLRAAPLTFSTLASLIPRELKAEVKIIDEGVQDAPEVEEAKSFDLVGMTVITGSAPRAYELADAYREAGVPVVLGGPHVTLVPDEAELRADAIVCGYAEETWPELLRDFVAGRMRKRYVMRPDFAFADMQEIPFPRRELMKQSGYTTVNTFEATRGCVHSCRFCVVPTAWGRRPFQKPIGHVIDDIRQSGARKILFYDLNLIADIGYAKELFKALVPLRIKWYGLTTTLLGRDEELLDLVARSGCRGLLIGFESVSEFSLRENRKGFNHPDDYAGLIARLQSLGIALNGTFVFGGDADTPECFSAVGEFVLRNGIELPRFSILTPFPGTPLHQDLDREDRILTRDWSLYDGQHVVFQPRNMSVEELQTGHERVWREVYSWRGIGERIVHRASTRLGNLALIVGANLGYRHYAYNLSRFYTCNGGPA